MFFSIDRVEDRIAVLIDDDGNSTEAAAELFDTPPAEGQIVWLTDGRYRFDPEETATRRAEILALMRKLFDGE